MKIHFISSFQSFIYSSSQSLFLIISLHYITPILPIYYGNLTRHLLDLPLLFPMPLNLTSLLIIIPFCCVHGNSLHSCIYFAFKFIFVFLLYVCTGIIMYWYMIYIIHKLYIYSYNNVLVLHIWYQYFIIYLYIHIFNKMNIFLLLFPLPIF